MHQGYIRPKRLRRCQLSVPGSSDKMMAKAATTQADYVFLDLEDAVAPSAKVPARDQIVQALRTHDWRGKTRCVRINDLTTEFCYGDILHVVEQAHDVLDTIIVPKVKTPADVLWVDTLLNQIEKRLRIDRPIGMEVLIEEVEAMINVEAIAACCPRLEALIFGMGDFAASQGVKSKYVGAEDVLPGGVWQYHRNKVVIAARAAGIEAVDGPFANFRDEEMYRTECERAMVLGCVGKWAIHPSQIAIAQDVFSPQDEDVVRARKLAAAYADAEAQGLGSVSVDGVMVDVASIRIVRNTLAIADLIDAKEQIPA